MLIETDFGEINYNMKEKMTFISTQSIIDGTIIEVSYKQDKKYFNEGLIPQAEMNKLLLMTPTTTN